MKKTVSAYVTKLGGITKYSGNTKTMYIHTDGVSGITPEDIENAVINKFGYGLSFRVAS